MRLTIDDKVNVGDRVRWIPHEEQDREAFGTVIESNGERFRVLWDGSRAASAWWRVGEWGCRIERA